MNKSLYSLLRKAEHPFLWYFLSSTFVVLYFFIEHEGFYYGDDYSYSLYAHQLLQGTFQLDNYVFCHRFMVFAPTTLLYWLGGVNIYTTTAWPLLSTLGTLAIIYLSLRKHHPAAAAWAMVLLGFYYFQLNTVNYLYPDNIIMFLATCCLTILYRVREQLASAKAQFLWGMLFAVANLMAFLAKETIVYAVPFYIFLFIYQTKHHINLRFWGFAAFSGLVLLAGYFLLYQLFTGSAFLRFQDIEGAGSPAYGSDYFETSTPVLIARLTYQPLLNLVGSGLAIPVGFAITGVFAFKNLHHPKYPFSFWTIASLSMLLCLWFGSVSLEYYKPMYLQPRMFHPMLPAFCLAAGLAMEQTWHNHKANLFLALLFLLCVFLSGGKIWLIYLSISFLCLGLALYKKQVHFAVGLIIIMASLSTRPIHFMFKPTVFHYKAQESLMKKHLMHLEGHYTVLTDSLMLKCYPYFYGFDVPANYSFYGFSNYAKALHNTSDTVFILINNGMLEHPDLNLTLREKDILPLFPTPKLLDQKGKAKVFFIPPQ